MHLGTLAKRMHPELFEIPFIHLTVKTYGLMIVIGFLLALSLIRRLSRDITPDPQFITNAALYALIAGVVGSRLFFVAHYFKEKFQGHLLSIFAVWEGGLELLGGVLLAIVIIIWYLWYHKLHIRRYLDILSIGLLLAIMFGRIGCFMYGCCFGKPTNLPWGVRFPYGSLVYVSQVNPNLERNRPQPQLKVPPEFFDYVDKNGIWYPKPYADLTLEQKEMVKNGPYRCLPVHPTQLYSSLEAAVLCLVLFLFWRRNQRVEKSQHTRLFSMPGCTSALMFILYGVTRFFMEFLRDDNPFEFDGLTISQNISIVMVMLGVILIVVFQKAKPDGLPLSKQSK